MGRRILLVIGGGIAAYKCLDLIRRLRERGISVRAVLTEAARHFVTPLAVAALTQERVATDLFSPETEHETGHIRLTREADLVVVAPATADLLAKMAHGHGNDLASALLLASDKPVLAAPAMNPHMWRHPAVQRNVAQLKADGIHFVGPAEGEMAEPGEAGWGRLVEVPELVERIERLLAFPAAHGRRYREAEAGRSGEEPVAQLGLFPAGVRVLVTSGPTHEPIDPVRYLANRSSGRQGHAIAAAAARAGAAVTLVSGPVTLPAPLGVAERRVETAAEMLAAVRDSLPVEVAVFAAAVADWRPAEVRAEKMKKIVGEEVVTLAFHQNADILKEVAAPGPLRPLLVIGFAAETEDVLAHAAAKLAAKGADWIVANDVSHGSGVMGGAHNRVHLLTREGVESWPEMSKEEVAERLVARMAAHLKSTKNPMIPPGQSLRPAT